MIQLAVARQMMIQVPQEMMTGSLRGKITLFLSLHTTLMKMQLYAWMEMVAKLGADLWQLKKIQILIHPLPAIYVINGTMLFVWDLILKGLQIAHGYAQVDAGAQLTRFHRNQARFLNSGKVTKKA